MFKVYAIHNVIRNKIYIGHTADLEKRLKRHNGLLPNKATAFTNRQSGYWELVYCKEFETRKEAMKREKDLKSFRGREFVKKLLMNEPTVRP